MENAFSSSRRFYENQVAPMIREKFPEYEKRIAVGLVGEGSDCFGYDDFVSRDHDFGTGVVLWLTDEDMSDYGNRLSYEYDKLISPYVAGNLTERLRVRRGVMTIRMFYSNILDVPLDTDKCVIGYDDWMALDHNCLATAVNGEVFRDDLGEFTAFRNMLLNYYPDNIWRIRIVNELHRFAQSLQVNYARCMSRDDIVAARMCHFEGLNSAMQLFFLMKREYPPYYKWTYRRMCEIDTEGRFSGYIKELSETVGDRSVWEGKDYMPGYRNLSDPIVLLAERLAGLIVAMLREHGLTDGTDPYLETYVGEIQGKMR